MGPPFIIELKDCEYNKQRKTIIYRHTDKTSNKWIFRFPREIIVVSHITNRKVVFRTIGEDHPKFDQDQWDGEQQIYENTEPALKTVDLLYVTAQ